MNIFEYICICNNLKQFGQNKSTKGINITCAIPVNLRKEGEEIKVLGNKFGFLTCQLPLSPIDASLKRVKEITKRMNKAKSLPESHVGMIMQNIMLFH